MPILPFVPFDPDAAIAKTGRHFRIGRQDGCDVFRYVSAGRFYSARQAVQWQAELREWLLRNPEPRTAEQEAEYAEQFAERSIAGWTMGWVNAGCDSRRFQLLLRKRCDFSTNSVIGLAIS